MAKITKAQLRNLAHIAAHGKPLPRSSAAYHCRVKGLSEFIWVHEDGRVSTDSERAHIDEAQRVQVIGERLTLSGRAALAEQQP